MQVYLFSNYDRTIIVYASNDEEAYTVLGDHLGKKEEKEEDAQFYSQRKAKKEKGVIADIINGKRLKA